MDKLEKGKKVMNSIFTRFGSANTVSPQTPAFAGGGAGIHGEKKISSREKKKS
jgi:hypothetical protein